VLGGYCIPLTINDDKGAWMLSYTEDASGSQLTGCVEVVIAFLDGVVTFWSELAAMLMTGSSMGSWNLFLHWNVEFIQSMQTVCRVVPLISSFSGWTVMCNLFHRRVVMHNLCDVH
jgi:hypothetical protein